MNKNQNLALNEKIMKKDQIRIIVENLERENKKHMKLKDMNIRKEIEITQIKANNEARKETLKNEYHVLSVQLEAKQKIVDEESKEIEQKMRHRDLLNKDVVTEEENERKKMSYI